MIAPHRYGYKKDTMLYAEDLDTIRNSHFNPKRPTQFLVHGFIDDGSVRWMKVKSHLLQFRAPRSASK